MEYVSSNNFNEAKNFILDNIARSGFMYGNLSDPNAVSYILRKEGKIVAMTNILNSQYCTYLFPENTDIEVIEEVITKMKAHKHRGGTVAGDYYDIFAKHYELSDNCQNELASLQGFTPNFWIEKEIKSLSEEDILEYYEAVSQIDGFTSESVDDVKFAFENPNTKIVISKADGKIVAGATLSAISDRTAVVTTVFTLKDYRNQGHAGDCLKQLLNEYAETRTIMIFFTNPIAKQMYLSLGFKVDEQLLMIGKPIL